MTLDMSEYCKETQELKSINKCEICQTKVEILKSNTSRDNISRHILCVMKAECQSKQRKSHKICFKVQSNPNMIGKVNENTLVGKIEEMVLAFRKILNQCPNLIECGIDQDPSKINHYIDEIFEETKILGIKIQQETIR